MVTAILFRRGFIYTSWQARRVIPSAKSRFRELGLGLDEGLDLLSFSCSNFLLALPGVPSVYAQTANGGRAAFDFLNISPITRAVGMGGAYTALGDDSGSIYYNPAGLASVLTNEMNLTYLDLYQSISYEFITFAYPLESALPGIGGTVAVSANLLQPGSQNRTDDNNNITGTFSSGDSVYTLAYAKAFGPNFHVGMSVKYIQQQIDTASSSLFDMDLGVVVLPSFDGMRVGIALKNLGAESSGFNLPLTLDTGISYRRYEILSEQDDGALTVDATFPIQPIEDSVGMSLGGEYNFKWVGSRATLRLGYTILGNSLSGVGFAVGAGYGIDFSGAVIFLDYAYTPEDIFGDANRFSLTTKF